MRISLIFSLFLLANNCIAQELAITDSISTIGQCGDALDLWRLLTKSNKKRSDEGLNYKPGKVYLSSLPGIGYTLQSRFTLVSSNNISFYLGNKKNTNLSIINSDLEYSYIKNHLVVPIIFSIWKTENKMNLVGDMRFYHYPTYTYGLGTESVTYIKDLVNYNYLKIHMTLFKPLRPNLYIGVGVAVDYHWKISSTDSNTNYLKYNNGVSSTITNGMVVNIKYDTRKNINNPQGGMLASLTLRENTKFLRSSYESKDIVLDFRKYIRFSSKPYRLLALWSYNWFTFGKKVPYLDLPSTGWDVQTNMGRGYIQGRLRGANLISLEAEYRFNYSKSGLLGGVIFAN